VLRSGQVWLLQLYTDNERSGGARDGWRFAAAWEDAAKELKKFVRFGPVQPDGRSSHSDAA
jgi:hypothetical protein